MPCRSAYFGEGTGISDVGLACKVGRVGLSGLHTATSLGVGFYLSRMAHAMELSKGSQLPSVLSNAILIGSRKVQRVDGTG